MTVVSCWQVYRRRRILALLLKQLKLSNGHFMKVFRAFRRRISMYATSLLSQMQSNVLQRATLFYIFARASINSMVVVLINKLHISDRKNANPFTERIADAKELEV